MFHETIGSPETEMKLKGVAVSVFIIYNYKLCI